MYFLYSVLSNVTDPCLPDALTGGKVRNVDGRVVDIPEVIYSWPMFFIVVYVLDSFLLYKRARLDL